MSGRHRVGRFTDDAHAPTRSGRVQVGPAGGHQLGAVPGIPAVGPPGQRGRSAYRTRVYVIGVKVPSGVKLMPHWHPEDRVYTVMSGVFYIGMGSQFDEAKLQAYPPGAVIVPPGGTLISVWAKSGYQIFGPPGGRRACMHSTRCSSS